MASSNHFAEMEKKQLSENPLWRDAVLETQATFHHSLAIKLGVHATLWRAFISQNKVFLNANFGKYISDFIDRAICTILLTSVENEMRVKELEFYESNTRVWGWLCYRGGYIQFLGRIRHHDKSLRLTEEYVVRMLCDE